MIIKLHRVISGPYPDPDGDGYYNLCLVEFPDGELSDEEIYIDSIEDAFEMIKHLMTRIEPIEIKFDVLGIDNV